MSMSFVAYRAGPGRTVVALALALGASQLVASDAGAVSQRVKNACRSDYQRFCPQYAPESSQARSCMSTAGKRRQLTPRCYNALIDAGLVPKKYITKK